MNSIARNGVHLKVFYLKRFFLGSGVLATCLFAGQPFGLAAEGYRLNPGDRLDISVWQEENLKQEVVVLPDGSISFPLVGSIRAAGRTSDELVGVLRERLSQFIPSPEVTVTVLAAEGNVVYVIGEVAKPGTFVIKGPTHVMQALSMAGGLTEFAKKNRIIILRHESDGKTMTLPFEYGDVEDGEELQTNVLLKSGDTVVVP